MRRHVSGSLSVALLFLVVYSAAAQNEGGLRRITTIDEASREILALEVRSKGRHDVLLEDTQALAEAYDGLVQQNADRVAEIAALKQEIANIRSELSALKAARK